MPRFQRRQKLVEEPKCPAPKITDGRMEINGMNGNDCGKATGKAILGYLQACLDGKLPRHGRLEIHRAVQMQNAISVKVRRHGASRPVLGHLNTALRPRVVRAVVRTIAGGASRTRGLRKKSR